MKKILLTAGIIAGMLGTAAAKPTVKKKMQPAAKRASYISLGPTVGLGGSWVTGLGGQNAGMFSGAAGVAALASTQRHWAWGGQLLISGEGYAKNMTINGVNYTPSVAPVYLRIQPLTMNYFFLPHNRVRPKLYIGPSLGLKIAERRMNDMPEGTIYASSDQFRTVDFGLTGGAGVNIRLSRAIWLNMDLGYYQGLVDVYKYGGTSDYNVNENLRFNVGVLFGL